MYRFVPFLNQMQLEIHFQKHGHKFGAITIEVYEEMADEFLFGQMNANTRECTRQNGKQLRFDFLTSYFGAKYPVPPVVLTFYPVAADVIARRGGTNRFFTSECGRND